MARLPPALVALVLVCAGCGETAPPTSLLPLPPGTRVLASAATGDLITSADHRRFREMIVAGPPGISLTRLRDMVVEFAVRRGWHIADRSPPGVLIDAPDRKHYAAVDDDPAPEVSVVDHDEVVVDRALERAVALAHRAREPAIGITLGPH